LKRRGRGVLLMTKSINDLDLDSACWARAVGAVRRIADHARLLAEALDVDGAFPVEEVQALADQGLLAAPLPRRLGGAGLLSGRDGARALAKVLELLGGGSLALGRLYEGHVNALALIEAYAREEQLAHYAARARDGNLFSVWNTERDQGVRLIESGGDKKLRLDGAKIFASGAGFVTYPLITARTESGDLLMLIANGELASSDLSQWRAHGMRASASGQVDFSGIEVDSDSIIGGPDDFHRQPMFSAGAWRFAAVQLGGIAALYDLARAHLVKAGRSDNPHQLARMGAAAMAVEAARLWILRACVQAQNADLAPKASVAYVNLTRLAVERAGLDVLELTHRSVGLAGFLRPNPIERISRDLATYLRQPAPDEALCDAARFIMTTDRPISDVWTETLDEMPVC
jgi:alkylation response protein AidB-like acyl-CoA dehydrogenase